MRTPSMRDELLALEKRKSELSAKFKHAPTPAPRLHPKLADIYRQKVDDLHAVLAELRAEGVQVDDKVEELEYGKFGWIIDPEGNRIELWEPPKPKVT